MSPPSQTPPPMSQETPYGQASDSRYDDTLKKARAAFNRRFLRGHHPATLSAGAEKHQKRIFARTICDAIANGFCWEEGTEPTEFALDRIADIATMARYLSGEDKVSLNTLEYAERVVIRYWKKKCSFGDAKREIFCKRYDDDGNVILGGSATGPCAEP